MQIKFASVMVDDQEKALKFYTEMLGFTKHADIPFGEFRWLTVISPHGVMGAELVLEPMGFPPAKAYQKALFDAGIPADGLHDHRHPERKCTARQARRSLPRRAAGHGADRDGAFRGHLRQPDQPRAAAPLTVHVGSC